VKLCDKCDKQFNPKVSYQIYCGEECRASATKVKILEKYNKTRRQKRIGKVRKCLGGCNQQLSIYNDSGFCSNCNISKKETLKMLKKIKGFFDYEQE
jgi:ABC-type phosphate/phosphonate transport system ATPase subunit